MILQRVEVSISIEPRRIFFTKCGQIAIREGRLFNLVLAVRLLQ